MFDIGWSELLVIGVVALVVIGPKELPRVLRTVGQGVAKLRRMAGEFQGQFNEALREAELSDLKDNVSALKNDLSGLAADARNSISNAIPTNPLQDIETELKAPTGSVERADLPVAGTASASDAVADQLPPPGDLEPHPFETIEEEVRTAAAQLEPAKTEPVKAEAAKSEPAGTEGKTAAAKTEPAVAQAAADAKPKRSRIAAKPPAKVAASAEATPKKPAVRRAPRKSATVEPEVSAAVADLDAPAPARKPASKAEPKAIGKVAAKPRAKAKPDTGNEGPAA
ncbi:Sec-independent protein translocase protein TatB [Starkeya nomas]|uniref:Sec-independent protein translocase protein TatB n=1 Tax=Starkeya nomas TaxID=2666134 RepID=A0A5S9NQ17_9HYPH|nr:Sec-independent protein translocase protein TatB [Starkeya nomas]CAA0092539.1 Sec-independent protein translocase protein TatB [Starkeya nomas]